MPRREHELRCFCARNPLLATYGIDKRGNLFIHVKIWKSDRIFGELVIEVGIVKIRCRNCLRWHVVRIVGRKATLEETHDELPLAVFR
jgi:hypothetical protein